MKYLTAPLSELFDVEQDGPPASGSHVLALGPGGKLVEEVWSSKSPQYFYAWCHFPKVKQVTKDRMMKQFIKDE